MNIVGRDASIREGEANQSSHSLPPLILTNFNRLKSRHRKRCKERLAKPCFIHAEVQLLMELEPQLKESHNPARVFDYIGCSRRTCYLCCNFIQELGYFRTRGSHGKVYDQGTVPSSNDLPTISVYRFIVALATIEDDMKTHFDRSLGSRQLPHVAESSIGNSVHSDTSIERHRLRQIGLDTEGLNAPSSSERRKDSPTSKLGKTRTSFRAARIPADSGIPIGIVRLITHEIEKGYSCIDQAMNHVPNFAEYWGEACNFDRAMHRFNAINQELKSLNGDYRIHWNRNDELPQNETLKAMLGLVDVPSYRHSWYGDVFIERIGEVNGSDFDEHAYHLYDDVPPAFLESQLIRLMFRNHWENNILEDELEDNTVYQDLEQKAARDKELVLQRMYVRDPLLISSAEVAFYKTPIQRRVLELMPAGTLDLIVLAERDVDAIEKVEVEDDPDKLEFVQVTQFFRENAMIEGDMKGFPSSQL